MPIWNRDGTNSPFKFLQEVRAEAAEGHLADAPRNRDHHR